MYEEFGFFCKPTTAYEMRISDGSSDVCSSDLPGSTMVAESASGTRASRSMAGRRRSPANFRYCVGSQLMEGRLAGETPMTKAGVMNSSQSPLQAAQQDYSRPLELAGMPERGRAQCRERVCQSVWISVVADDLRKTKTTNSRRLTDK